MNLGKTKIYFRYTYGKPNNLGNEVDGDWHVETGFESKYTQV